MSGKSIKALQFLLWDWQLNRIIYSTNFQYFSLRREWLHYFIYKINTFAQMLSGSDSCSNKKLLIYYKRQRFMTSYSISFLLMPEDNIMFEAIDNMFFVKGKKWWQQTFLHQGQFQDFENFWILKVLSHFMHPPSCRGLFWSNLLPAVMPANSEGFIRGVKKEGDMSGTELGFISDPLSPSSEHVYRNTSANLQSARHPIRMVYFSHICLFSALKTKKKQ